jgi:hypothetical protein
VLLLIQLELSRSAIPADRIEQRPASFRTPARLGKLARQPVTAHERACHQLGVARQERQRALSQPQDDRRIEFQKIFTVWTLTRAARTGVTESLVYVTVVTAQLNRAAQTTEADELS